MSTRARYAPWYREPGQVRLARAIEESAHPLGYRAWHWWGPGIAAQMERLVEADERLRHQSREVVGLVNWPVSDVWRRVHEYLERAYHL